MLNQSLKLLKASASALVLVSFLSTSLLSQIVINEIHYDQDDKTIPEEFIELYNAGPEIVDLTGWHITDGIFFSFPDGTEMEPDSYLIVAQDPEVFAAKFGVMPTVGPYDGRLDNDGDELILRDAEVNQVDRVNYNVGFPWPLDSNGKGSSMELIHPSLDNDLGSSWRASGIIASGPPERVFLFSEEATDWKYRKGTSEASNPVGAWRELDFVEDASWLTGQTSLGYSDDDDNTPLDDMRDNYSSVFLRKKFTIDSEDDIVPNLNLGIYIDDGCLVWINGHPVGRFYMDDGEIPFDDFAGRSHEANDFEDYPIPNPQGVLNVGENVIAIHAFNASIRSSDFSVDARIFIPAAGEGAVAQPSPGVRNSVYSESAPPNVRQVNHAPDQPPANSEFKITAKVTDPELVSEVLVRYQVVDPGNYIPAHLAHPHNVLLARADEPFTPNPEFEDPANWSEIVMRDDGQNGDFAAGDDIYTATMPPQGNRTLFRYRIVATDTENNTVVAPFQDDESLNFACFIYDGVPQYGVTTSVLGGNQVYSEELMNSLPVYHLITLNSDWQHCIGYNSAHRISKGNERARDRFNWEGAFVYNGKVYDHVRYRLRQANDRYGGSGKRSMRIRFKRGNYVQLHDNYGKPYRRKWRTLNTGKMFDNKDVGNFGLTETLNANLWNMVGVPSPWMHTFHLRVVDGVQEAPSGSQGQYSGDFHGMHLAMENYDAIFMDTHRLEDGNLYKLKDGQFRGADLLRNQGRFAIKPDADFQNIRANLRPSQTAAWVDAHVNYDVWYPYHTVVEAIRHYDFRPADSHSKNRAWYFEPDYERTQYGRLWTLPHDSDASWGPNWNSGEDYSKAAIFNDSRKSAFRIKYRNFMREFINLIWTREVIERMIDDLAAFVIDFSNADRDRFRTAPGSEGRQDFGTITFKIQDMKNFAFTGWTGGSGPTVPSGGRARHMLNLTNAESSSSRIPRQPTISYTGEAGYPVDGLSFDVSDFDDPQGDNTFGNIEWMIAEITPSGVPFDRLNQRVYEYTKPWRSGPITEFSSTFFVPPRAVKTGRRYRARARMTDSDNYASHWSEPVEFTTIAATDPPALIEALKITEIMYNPLGGGGFEFVELQNLGTETISLEDVRFTEGIEFDFAEGNVTELAPNQIVLVVRDLQSFSLRYPNVNPDIIAGQYSGGLSNSGEDLELTWGGNFDIQQFDYLDDWFESTDGAGFSLRVFDPFAPIAEWNTKANWLPSSEMHGSPGVEDFASITAGLRKPGDANGDGFLNIGDAITTLLLAFQPGALVLPCDGEHAADGGNLLLLDFNGDDLVDGADAVSSLTYLFLQGPPHTLGAECTRIEGCSSLPCN